MRWYRDAISIQNNDSHSTATFTIGAASIDHTQIDKSDCDAVELQKASISCLPTWPQTHPLAVDGQISVGALIGANILAARALMPVNRLVTLQDQISRMEDSYNELNKFSSYASDKSEGREIQDLKGKIVLEDAFFQYPEQKNPIFESLNLVVNRIIRTNYGSYSIKEIKLEELIDIYPKMLKGETSGRYIIDVNK